MRIHGHRARRAITTQIVEKLKGKLFVLADSYDGGPPCGQGLIPTIVACMGYIDEKEEEELKLWAMILGVGSEEMAQERGHS